MMLLLFFTITFSSWIAPPDTPLAITKAYFADTLANSEQYICCEFAEKGLPPMNDNIIQEFELVDQDSSQAVVAVTLTNATSGAGMSTYVHLRYDQGWKIEAYRALTLPNFFFRIAAMSEKELMQFADSIAPVTNSQDKKEEALALQQRAQIITGTDERLAQHLQQHRNLLEEVLNTLKRNDILKKQSSLQDMDYFSKATNPLNTAEIIDVEVRPEDCATCFWFILEEMTDNSVGYVYAEDETDLPAMSASGYILLKKVADHWYIFKTT